GGPSGLGSSRSTFISPRSTVILISVLSFMSRAGAAELPALWAERVKSVVAVEYITESEIERSPSVSMGTVIDGNGTIVLPSIAIDPRTALSQLKEFKVYLPNDGIGTAAEYLGQDAFTGW